MSASERLSELLDYIEQVEKLKRKATFVVPSEFFLAFQGDMQGLPGLEFNQLAVGDDVWLRVPRLKEIPPPALDEKLAPWVFITALNRLTAGKRAFSLPFGNRETRQKLMHKANLL